MWPKFRQWAEDVPVYERDTCWICHKKIEPSKAPRALCAKCATSGGLGPYT